jgi:alpha-beta hydrolase superfamily lysophospholipase
VRAVDVRVDVSDATDLDLALETAATVFLPNRPEHVTTVIVGYPGGTYARGYFDIRHFAGYSQAEHHVDEGFVFVACDHLGIADSSPVDPHELSIERLAAANHATATTVVQQLRDGSLADAVPPIDVTHVVGIGQSMGGALLVVQQARHRTFAAVGILGYGLRSSFAVADGSRIPFEAPPRGADLRGRTLEPPADESFHTQVLRYSFHAAEEDPALVEVDMGGFAPDGSGELPRWRAPSLPPCAITMMGDGALAPEAAAIDVPVLIGCGAIDLLTDPRREPEWYCSTGDIRLTIVDRMAHMHNFAPTRARLWRSVTELVRSTSSQG